MSRVLVVADLHCGHQAGLTPPEYQYRPTRSRSQWNKWATLQRQVWDWYARTLRRIGPVDDLLILGDCIDGRGEKSRSTELITVDRTEQVEMADVCLQRIDCQRRRLVFGTPYHTGKAEDYERLLAERLSAKIGSHEWIKVGGLILDLKHHQTPSTTPHGTANSLGKEILNNQLWALRGEQPAADVILRAHAHRFGHLCLRVGPKTVWGFSLPSLQAYGSKYGARRCSVPVDVGMLVLEIQRGQLHWTPYFANVEALQAQCT